MISLSIPALCFAGYKIWKWIDDISKPEEELYEYKYLDDLDRMLECKLDDMKNPDIADVDTIKIDKKIFSLELFRSFKKNYRKKLLRQSEKTPIIKCVPIPAEEICDLLASLPSLIEDPTDNFFTRLDGLKEKSQCEG